MIAPFRQLEQNVRFAVRTLLRQRVFFVAALVSLGVAIGVNTTMYTMLEAMMNPRAAGVHPERLYSLRYLGNVRGLPPDAVSSALRTGGRTYDDVTGYRTSPARTTLSMGSHARDVQLFRVRPDFFEVVGVAALEGRLAPIANPDGLTSVVINDRLRGELFPGGDSPIGALITLDGRSGQIVGVVRRYAAFSALDTDAWVFETDNVDRAVPINLMRLRAGAAMEAVHSELSTIAARLALAADVPAGATRFIYKPVPRQFRVQGMHFALVAGVLAVLFVACANLGNLQLARGLDRGRELAMRASLGATRRDLIALLLTESAVIAFGGLLLGVLLTFWGIELLRSSVPRQVATYFISPEPSWRVFAFAGGVSVVCLILIGVVPAIRLSAVNLDSLLKSGAGTGAHRAHRQRYGWLLIAQIGLTLPVLTGAVLIGRATATFADPTYRMTRLYGEDPDSIVVARMEIAAARGAYVRMAPIVADLVHRASSVPHVSAVGVQFVDGPVSSGVTVAEAAGYSREVPALAWTYSVVSPGFFRARGVPIERGRGFVDGAHAQASVIVDRSTATFLWPKQNAVGQLVKLGASRSNAPWLRVSGVSGDHLDSVGRAYRAWVDTLRLRNVYRVITDADSVRAGSNGVFVAVYARTTRDPVLATIALRQALAGMPVATPPRVTWLRDDYGASSIIIQRTFMTSIFGGAAVICLALSAFGVYAIVAQSVAQRRREIAVRIFLGATPRGILKLILREGNVYILAGVAVGLMLAMRTLHWLAMLLSDEERTGVVWFASASAGVFVLAALAALIPAMRATRVDPAEALRWD